MFLRKTLQTAPGAWKSDYFDKTLWHSLHISGANEAERGTMEGVGVGEMIGDKLLSDGNILSRDVCIFPWLAGVVQAGWLTGVTTLHGGEETLGQCPDIPSQWHTARSKQTVLCQETPLDLFVKTNSHHTLRLTSSLNKHQWTPLTVRMPELADSELPNQPDHK